MSLRVWLPLNGDLTNNGLSDVTVTNNGATVDNSGKIGKCYYFNGSAQWLQLSDPINIFSGDFSYAVWLKPTDSTRSIIISDYASGKGSNVAFELTANRKIRLYWNGSPDIYPSNCTLPINEWTHCAIVKTTNQVQFYTNGVLRHTYTGTLTDKTTQAGLRIGDDYRGGTGVSYMGYINDIRIYDHALSPKEVKLLSQGLVCHYKLNDWLDGINPNRLSLFPKSYNPSSYNAYQFSMTENLVAGETYTLQLWDVDVSHSEKTEAQLGVWIFWGGGSVMLGSWAGSSYFTNGHADHLVKTFTITASQASGSGATNAWFNMYNSVGYVAGTMNMHIGRWKLEKGSIATPYCHTIEEMGGVDTLVYDSSGYNNHCNVEGTLSGNSNTPRNAISTYFTNPAGAFAYLNITLPQFTFSFWAKHTVANKMLMGSNASLDSTNNKWYWYGDNSFKYDGGEFYYEHNAGSAESLFGTWIHFVATYDGSTIKVYRNGISEGSKSVTGNKVLEYLSLGNGYVSNYRENGYLSDFRLYATALSQEDIQELYNAPVSIANTGTMLTQGEFVEVAT